MESNEEISKYIDQMTNIHDFVLIFLDNPYANADNDFNNLLKIIDKHNIQQDKEKFNHFIELIIKIANNHHRKSGFFNKIERILINYQSSIKENNSNEEIYYKFESNKRLLYFLIKAEILIVDNHVKKLIENRIELNGTRYSNFFITEIQKIDKDDELVTYYLSNLEEYEEKRQLGENDSYICSLIRNDSVEEFISFVNRTNISLSTRIKPSIFETNLFLIDKEPTLIEYSAFFGSIQIFQYLYLNRVEANGSLWIYAIHSNNSDFLRNYIENKHIEPDDRTFKEVLNECIKCHHNEIARYIQDNLINENKEQIFINQISSIERYFENVIKYNNYSFFPNEFHKDYEFYYLCKYNYTNIVNILIKSRCNDIEKNRVFLLIFESSFFAFQI